MKNSYKGFYSPTENELQDAWKSENTIFIFDTNVLLNIYSYKEQTRTDFLLSLETLNEKIWIPFHVGLEYQRRRLDIVSREKSIFRSVFNKLEELNKFKENLNEIEERFPELVKHGDTLCSELKLAVNKYKEIVEEIDKNQPCVRSHDTIREKLNELFNNKVGTEPEQTDIIEIEKEGEIRYTDKIPPGFKDANKGDEFFYYGHVKYKNKYGDLIIWKQILEYVKENNDINNVIFITDDIKSDWWFSIDSGGKKTIGPNALLINEIKEIENINLFHMYTTSDFLSEANKYYKELKISNSSIEETKDSGRKDHINLGHSSLSNMLKVLQSRENSYLDEIERMNKFAHLDEIERMNKLAANLKEIERMNKLAHLDEIERMNKFAHLDEIEGMNKLAANLKEIERMKKFAHLDEIEDE
ncbi:PIN-like domain-containing protein [Pasteurella multocida]|uniref:PIN-like domain-containing protein n=1 Tax=Pasteurella multocida TaxID=747 RepID=UPI002FDF47D4